MSTESRQQWAIRKGVWSHDHVLSVAAWFDENAEKVPVEAMLCGALFAHFFNAVERMRSMDVVGLHLVTGEVLGLQVAIEAVGRQALLAVETNGRVAESLADSRTREGEPTVFAQAGTTVVAERGEEG